MCATVRAYAGAANVHARCVCTWWRCCGFCSFAPDWQADVVSFVIAPPKSMDAAASKWNRGRKHAKDMCRGRLVIRDDARTDGTPAVTKEEAAAAVEQAFRQAGFQIAEVKEVKGQTDSSFRWMKVIATKVAQVINMDVSATVEIQVCDKRSEEFLRTTHEALEALQGRAAAKEGTDIQSGAAQAPPLPPPPPQGRLRYVRE